MQKPFATLISILLLLLVSTTHAQDDVLDLDVPIIVDIAGDSITTLSFTSNETTPISLSVIAVTDGIDPVARIVDANGDLVGINDNHETDNPTLAPQDALLQITLDAGTYAVQILNAADGAGSVVVLIERFVPTATPTAPPTSTPEPTNTPTPTVDAAAAVDALNEAVDAQAIEDLVDTASQQLQQGNFEALLNTAELMLLTDPDDVLQYHSWAYNFRGLANRGLGNNAEAVEDYTLALELIPEAPTVYTNRGNAYFWLGEYELAEQDALTAISLADPDDGDTIGFAYYVLGSAYHYTDQFELAENALSESVNNNPTDPVVFLLRANNFTHLGEGDLALQYYNTAIALDEDYTAAYRDRGMYFYYRDNFEAALLDLQRYAKTTETEIEDFVQDALADMEN